MAEDGLGPGPGMLGTGFGRPQDDQRDIVGGVAVQRRSEQALGDRFEVVPAERGAQLLVAQQAGQPVAGEQERVARANPPLTVSTCSSSAAPTARVMMLALG